MVGSMSNAVTHAYGAVVEFKSETGMVVFAPVSGLCLTRLDQNGCAVWFSGTAIGRVREDVAEELRGVMERYWRSRI